MQPEQIILFVYEEKKIRVTRDGNGNPWFVAKDVCEVLGIIWMGNKTLSNIPDSWKGVGKFPTPSSGHDKRGGGVQKLIIINEPALYKLSFRSNKAEADRFTNWVVSEVLPAIRKTGTYILPGKEQWDGLRDITINVLADETESAFPRKRQTNCCWKKACRFPSGMPKENSATSRRKKERLTRYSEIPAKNRAKPSEKNNDFYGKNLSSYLFRNKYFFGS